MYWYGGGLKLKCFFLKGSTRFREGPCTRKGAGFAWQTQGCDPVPSQLWVHGAGEPCHQHTAHPQRARNTILSCSSSPAGRNGAAHSVGAHPPVRAVRTALDHHFWTRFGVYWRLFGSWMTLILTSHLCPICTGTRKEDPGTSLTISKQLLKDPNVFGSQFEECQDYQWKFSRTEEDNAVLNNTGHKNSCKCDHSTLPQSTQLLKTTGTQK